MSIIIAMNGKEILGTFESEDDFVEFLCGYPYKLLAFERDSNGATALFDTLCNVYGGE